nr:MAG TPA: hypothetical protein [Bacteriophage sp.]
MRMSSNNFENVRKYGVVKDVSINYSIKTCLTHS